MQTRDMYIPPGDVGFWQGALRDPDDPQHEMGRKVIEGHGEWVGDVLYGDEDGGQRVIGRFRCQPTPWTGSGATQETADPRGVAGPRGGTRPPRARRRGPADPRGSPGPAAGDTEHPVWMLTVARHWNSTCPTPGRPTVRSALAAPAVHWGRGPRDWADAPRISASQAPTRSRPPPGLLVEPEAASTGSFEHSHRRFAWLPLDLSARIKRSSRFGINAGRQGTKRAGPKAGR